MMMWVLEPALGRVEVKIVLGNGNDSVGTGAAIVDVNRVSTRASVGTVTGRDTRSVRASMTVLMVGIIREHIGHRHIRIKSTLLSRQGARSRNSDAHTVVLIMSLCRCRRRPALRKRHGA